MNRLNVLLTLVLGLILSKIQTLGCLSCNRVRFTVKGEGGGGLEAICFYFFGPIFIYVEKMYSNYAKKAQITPEFCLKTAKFICQA